MAAQVSIVAVNPTAWGFEILFNVAFSGSYSTGGDALNFSGSGTLPATQDPAFVGMYAGIPSESLLQVDAWSQGGQITYLYVPIVTKSGTPSTINPQSGVKVKILSALGTELSAGSYPAAITGDTVTGWAAFTRN